MSWIGRQLHKIHYNAPVTLTFSLAAVCVFVLLQVVPAEAGLDRWFTLQRFSFSDPAGYIGLVSYTLGHSTTGHLLGNLTFILLVAPSVEERYGGGTMLLMMLATALLTAAFHLILFPNAGLWGASGLVFLMIILVSFANAQSGRIPLTFILVFLLFVGQEVVKLWDDNSVSELAHIAGGICGGLFGLFVTPKKGSRIFG